MALSEKTPESTSQTGQVLQVQWQEQPILEADAFEGKTEEITWYSSLILFALLWKIEVLAEKPLVHIYHDILSETEVKVIKNRAVTQVPTKLLMWKQ